jgi:hypothetical protein
MEFLKSEFVKKPASQYAVTPEFLKSEFVKKPASQYAVTPIVIGQVVILLDDRGRFINCWHAQHLASTKPGTLDIHKR